MRRQLTQKRTGYSVRQTAVWGLGRALCWGGLALSLSPLGVAMAQTAPSAGGQPPQPSVDARDDRVQRRAIRGGSVDLSRESPELRELRGFEEESFPRATLRQSVVSGQVERPAGGAAAGGLGSDGGGELPADGLHSPPTAGPTPPRSLFGGDTPTIPWLQALKLLDNLGLSPTFVRFESHVIRYLEFFKEERRGRSIMTSWLRKQGRYRQLIEQTLDKHGLPRFLLYVAMIESGYDPHDRSHKGAVGLWQFMPEGARIYGLRVDHWVDERKDPVRSTEAAARYLGDLKARFGSWHLALAAFNAGYGAVLRSLQKYNTNDYYELCRHENGLPWETVLYVPKAFAAAIVGENRQLFGYDNVEPDKPYEFDRVAVPSSTSLANVAKAAGATLAEVVALNPELRRGRTPPERWDVRVPKGRGKQLTANWSQAEEALALVTVRQGERLDELAKQNRISVRELKQLNGIEDVAEIKAGLALLVPQRKGAPAPNDKPTATTVLASTSTATTPAPGSSLIAPSGETVIVAVPDKDLVEPGKRRVFYRSAPRDKIADVAAAFSVKQVDLLRWNALELDAPLPSGLVLQVWVPPTQDLSKVALLDESLVRLCTTGSDEFFDLVEAKRGRKRLVHQVKAGEDLAHIAKKYGLTSADLERINRLSERATPLFVGQKLVVYRNLTAAEKAEAMKQVSPGMPELTPGTPPEDDPALSLVGSRLPMPDAVVEPTQDPASSSGGSDEPVRLPRLPSTFTRP